MPQKRNDLPMQKDYTPVVLGRSPAREQCASTNEPLPAQPVPFVAAVLPCHNAGCLSSHTPLTRPVPAASAFFCRLMTFQKLIAT